MRILVAGGRDFSDFDKLSITLSSVTKGIKREDIVIIQGGAKGADRLAWEWAKANQVRMEEFKANWGLHGRAAGPIRNQEMLTEGKPDIAVIAPGGRGTADMVRRLENASIPIFRVDP